MQYPIITILCNFQKHALVTGKYYFGLYMKTNFYKCWQGVKRKDKALIVALWQDHIKILYFSNFYYIQENGKNVLNIVAKRYTLFVESAGHVVLMMGYR